jgi:hypothetical protein
MLDNPIAIIAAIAIVCVFIYHFFFSRNVRINRKLKRAPWKKISSFRTGETAKIVGTIVPVDEVMIAPLSKRECSHYFVEVEQKKSSGKSSHWDTIIQKEITSRFLIKDGEHYAFIHDHRVMSNIVVDKNYSSGTFKDATDLLESYLREHGYESENWLGWNKTIRYEEGVLEPNEQVSVLGTGNWKSAKDLALPEEYGKVLAISAADDKYVYLSDDPETTERNEIKPRSESKGRKRKYYRTPNSTVGH